MAECLPGPLAGGGLLTRERLWTLSRDAEYSVDRFRSATGFVPAVGLDEALSRIAVWYARTGR